MNCCDATIVPFLNVGIMDIAYSTSMKTRYGNAPSVLVYHRIPKTVDTLPEYEKANILIAIDGFPASTIHIDNGGAASGFVKIFR